MRILHTKRYDFKLFNSLCGGGTSHIDCKGPVEPLNLTGCTSSFDNKRLPEPPPNCISLRVTVSGRDQPVEDASDPAMRTGGRQRLETQTIRYARSCGQHTAMHSTLGCRRLQLVRCYYLSNISIYISRGELRHSRRSASISRTLQQASCDEHHCADLGHSHHTIECRSM